jgi:hypothetical protein
LRNGGDEKRSHGVNEVRLRQSRIVREGLHMTLSELPLRRDSPSFRKRWLSLCLLRYHCTFMFRQAPSLSLRLQFMQMRQRPDTRSLLRKTNRIFCSKKAVRRDGQSMFCLYFSDRETVTHQVELLSEPIVCQLP